MVQPVAREDDRFLYLERRGDHRAHHAFELLERERRAARRRRFGQDKDDPEPVASGHGEGRCEAPARRADIDVAVRQWPVDDEVAEHAVIVVGVALEGDVSRPGGRRCARRRNRGATSRAPPRCSRRPCGACM